MSGLLETLELRNRYRSTLLTIKHKICKLETDQIDVSQAQDAGIRQLPMSLEQASDCLPSFFTPYEGDFVRPGEDPYPPHKPDTPNHWNVQGLHWYMQSCLSQLILPHPSGICPKWGRFNFGALFETSYFWKVSSTCTALAKESLPHMKCLMESDAVGDERLLRGELITIINIMTGRLNTKSLRPHVLAPVMVFSTMGPQHLRVLEAFFDGQNLIVRQTRLYDMTEYDAGIVDLLTRWWLGFAAGQTKSVPNALLP
ncbi:hypothetical protein BO78DRAFT_329788 [Aspergillus sclerotiicarbonarius CBS 121057]|uniref:Uncharacterized protein n=1 Tax=Aspergillus sclerotiicarbonarius (strain CBS 121057 / IBT 28362) TaxID=1448318 RepID=A0A319DS72_ASPSB|nr:hypothetical protein BO78DRAFT_329788 [Aspergillus sclerotiicarbonarius CBS 121057]